MTRALFALVMFVASPALAEGRYFAAIQDLPIPPGLQESGSGFVFEGVEGRIVLAEAHGPGAAAGIDAFYRACLPALGWSEAPGAPELEFVRGRERLVLEIGEVGADVFVHVQLIAGAAAID